MKKRIQVVPVVVGEGRLIDGVRVGDKVTILTPHGQQRTGRAVMPSSHGGLGS